MHTAPMPCAVTSAAVPNFSSSNTSSATAGIERDERRGQQRVERHAPDDEPQRGIAAHEAGALADRAQDRHAARAGDGGGRRNEATTANTAKKLSVLSSERELVAAEPDHEPGERGTDHAPEVPLRRRERDRAGELVAGTRSGSIAWNAGKPIAFAHPAPSTISVTSPGLGSPTLVDEREQRGEEDLERRRGEQQRAARHAVGERAAERREQRGRHEPGGGDQSGPARLARSRW